MSFLRCVLVVGVVVTGVFASEPSQASSGAALCHFKSAVALPGTGLSAMTAAQAGRMVCRVNECLTGDPCDASRLESFESMVCCARQTGMVCVRRVTGCGRTLTGVCREMGVLVRR